MKNFYYLILISLFACNSSSSSSNKNFNISEIELELGGTLINDTITNTQRQIYKENSETKIFYKSSNKKIKEIDIHIHSKQDSTFPILVNYYNQKFNTAKKDTAFNTWFTDSSEFILYKNSDSSILVNIFKRTYL